MSISTCNLLLAGKGLIAPTLPRWLLRSGLVSVSGRLNLTFDPMEGISLLLQHHVFENTVIIDLDSSSLTSTSLSLRLLVLLIVLIIRAIDIHSDV